MGWVMNFVFFSELPKIRLINGPFKPSSIIDEISYLKSPSERSGCKNMYDFSKCIKNFTRSALNGCLWKIDSKHRLIGLHIDCKLFWRVQTDFLCQLFSRNFGVIKRFTHYFSPIFTDLIVYFIAPILTYESLARGNRSKAKIESIWRYRIEPWGQ